MNSFYEGKVILVTGGSGSIGREIVNKLIELNPKAIRVFDNNETALYELAEELKSDKIRTLIGDIRDTERLKRAFEGVDILFHAAALKHVPLCEYNPFDAVKTNVIGTQNVMDCAIDARIEKVILVSTDKAVNPISVMGATKLLAERLTISANYYSGDMFPIFSCVRFGNVLNSRGSVVPLFKNQIKNGGPVTVTDPVMSRFIMKIPDAAALILEAGEISRGGEIFILKMPAVNILDLAEVMIEELAPKYGFNVDEVNIEIIGKRVNEKIFEELMTEDEARCAIDGKNLIILNNDKKVRNNHFEYNSDYIDKLSKDEIKEIIKDIV